MQFKTVKASSFASLADLRAFERCIVSGKSEKECFAVGDNGVGLWGAITAQDHSPMVALPREIWKSARKAGGAGVVLRYRGKVVNAVLGDTMPRLANIRNGAGIDLNPAACKALGVPEDELTRGVEWAWAE